MRIRREEYSLADLVEQPGLSLAIERRGFERRSLERVLEGESCAEWRPAPPRRWDEFIAE